MDSLDELEVMFQHINVAGLSSVIPGVQKTTAPIDVDDDSNDNEDNGHTGQDAKKEGKRKANAVDNLLALRRKVGTLWLSKCHEFYYIYQVSQLRSKRRSSLHAWHFITLFVTAL